MWDVLDRLFGGQFMPHGHCYLWTPSMVWLQVISNLLIAFAYLSISLTLAYIVRRIKDIPFSWMYGAFGVFIVTCGFTHILDVVTIWHPIYWFDGGLRAVCAVASVGTALLLVPLVPKAIGLAAATELAHARGVQLEAAHVELNAAHIKTKELEQVKSDFFANVSHELRTPLALILGPTEKLLQSANLEPDQRRDLGVIGRNARTLLRHVNDLLDIAKLEAGRMPFSRAPDDLAALVQRVAGNFDSLADERKMSFTVETPKDLPADVDAEKLERALVNVVANAFKFAPDGGSVKVRLHVEDDRVHLEVGDSGPGVPEDLRTKIFERFTQLEADSTRRFGGTGLGLAITRDFVEMHGGTIAVSDSAEGGALFTISFPLIKPTTRAATAPRRHPVAEIEELRSASIPSPPVASEPAQAPSVSAPPEELKKPLVLVVEDNREMNAFVSEALSEHYQVERAFDGLEGLRKANEHKPDLILTDVMMPHIAGDELVTEIRKNPALDGVPIVVLTAKADDDLRVRALRTGASDYLQKPFGVEELKARAANLIGTKRARDFLRQEVTSQAQDLETLAKDLGWRKRELEGALETVRVARDQAERASAMKTEFLTMVSHELRTPLTAMQLVIDSLMLSSELPPRERKLVTRFSGSTERLTDLVDSLLQYAQLQGGKIETMVGRVNLTDIVTSVADELRLQATRKGLSLDLEVPSVAAIETDASLLRMVVVNLLSNAVKFTDHGSVHVSILPAKSGFVLRVKDSGRGVSEENLAHIFEPFRHVETVRKKHVPGIGLGLSLVREILDNLGGTIKVSSELGKGSTFEVTLPEAV